MSQHSEHPSGRPLAAFERLIGEWATTATHPQLANALHGQTTFEWLKDGALLVWSSSWQSGEGVPEGYSVIGMDDELGTYSVLYTDSRGVSRIYHTSMEDGVWRMWRNTPTFSQRMMGTFSDEGNTLTWHGELSRDGELWEEDLSLVCRRKSTG